jgi:hypothetical protein
MKNINVSLLMCAAFILGMIISDLGNSNNSEYRPAQSSFATPADSGIHSFRDFQNQRVPKEQTERTLQAIFDNP